MKIDYKTKKYGLLGNPISKTLSPFIHNNFYKEFDINNIYLAFEIDKNLENAIKGLRTLGFSGFNVTLPFKSEIIKYLDFIDDNAKKIGAINTVLISDNKLKGYNTDGLGFLKSLEVKKISLKNKNILVIGSGGAAKSICVSLLSEDIGKLNIANRTKENREKLKRDLLNIHDLSKEVKSFDMDLDGLDKKDIDIIINTTSVGMYPKIEDKIIDLEGFEEVLVYDIIYKPLETRLLKESKTMGFETMNGVDMLLYQAIYSQEIWLDRKIDKNEIESLYKKLYEALEGE